MYYECPDKQKAFTLLIKIEQMGLRQVGVPNCEAVFSPQTFPQSKTLYLLQRTKTYNVAEDWMEAGRL